MVNNNDLLSSVQVEQYGNLIFHGLEGSCQEAIAGLVARCVKVCQPNQRGEIVVTVLCSFCNIRAFLASR